MKTERRHELQKNDLADMVGTEIDHVKPYLKTILGVIVALLAVGFTIMFLSQQQATKNAVAWGELYEVLGSPSTQDLEKFSEDHNRTQPGEWALLVAANSKLQEGVRQMFENRQDAEESLSQAKKLFQKVLDSAPSQVMIRQRAQLGLAKTFESLNEPEAAIPHYEQLVQSAPDTPFGKAAAERLASLKRLNSEHWYAWFAEQKPAPALDPRSTNPLNINDLPGQDNLRTPGGDLSLPNLLEQGLKDLEKKGGDIQLPSDNPGPTAPPTTEPKTEAPATETPATETPAAPAPATPPTTEEPKTELAPPANATPAEEKKADEAPAAPADEKKPE